MSSISPETAGSKLHAHLHQAIEQVNGVVFGKNDAVELAFACLVAGGHLLIEDIPGVGKTTLAQALAVSVGADYNRIQFTSDLLPADIIGVSVYRRDQENFEFHPGPIFSQLVLADEVNRATPKTQSALLEAMAEGHVTTEGATRPLPIPFFVIATQNPLDTVGTFPLPDSQLDRFLLSLSLGYPDPQAERRVLIEKDRQKYMTELTAQLSPVEMEELQSLAQSIHVSEPLLDYVQDLIGATREHPHLKIGLSPRAGLALVRCCRALALIRGREFVIPEDVKHLFPNLAYHRLQLSESETASIDSVIESILSSLAIP